MPGSAADVEGGKREKGWRGGGFRGARTNLPHPRSLSWRSMAPRTAAVGAVGGVECAVFHAFSSPPPPPSSRRHVRAWCVRRYWHPRHRAGYLGALGDQCECGRLSGVRGVWEGGLGWSGGRRRMWEVGSRTTAWSHVLVRREGVPRMWDAALVKMAEARIACTAARYSPPPRLPLSTSYCCHLRLLCRLLACVCPSQTRRRVLRRSQEPPLARPTGERPPTSAALTALLGRVAPALLVNEPCGGQAVGQGRRKTR